MPVYEYFCSSCHTKFDALRPMREADKVIACTNCESERTARVLPMFFATGGGALQGGMDAGGGFRGAIGAPGGAVAAGAAGVAAAGIRTTSASENELG